MISLVRVALAGSGEMGMTHFRTYQRLSDVQVVGVLASSSQGRARWEGLGVPVFGSLEELVEGAAPDVVDLCTPTDLHPAQAIRALELGCHVIVEKPCALTADLARSMFAAARRQNRQLLVAQVAQFSEDGFLLRQLLEELPYGPALDAFFQRLGPRPGWSREGWFFHKERSGLVPFDLHIHDLDLAVSLFGPAVPLSFTSAGDDSLSLCRMEYRCGEVSVGAEAGWLHTALPFSARWRVCFRDALVVFDGTKATAYPSFAPPHALHGFPVPDPFAAELGHFLSCIRLNQPSSLVPEERVISVLESLEALTALSPR